MDKKVLVLLGTYNGEKYIAEQCQSLKRQRNVQVDVLVRDDGSSDNTVNVIKENYDNRINIIEGENVGACANFINLWMNASLEYDYYAFCDQDDYWMDNKLQIACEKLSTIDSNIPALYFCGQIITDEKLHPIYVHKMDVERNEYASCIFNQMAGCTAVFNKKLLTYMRKKKPNISFGHDVWTYR